MCKSRSYQTAIKRWSGACVQHWKFTFCVANIKYSEEVERAYNRHSIKAPEMRHKHDTRSAFWKVQRKNVISVGFGTSRLVESIPFIWTTWHSLQIWLKCGYTRWNTPSSTVWLKLCELATHRKKYIGRIIRKGSSWTIVDMCMVLEIP